MAWQLLRLFQFIIHSFIHSFIHCNLHSSNSVRKYCKNQEHKIHIVNIHWFTIIINYLGSGHHLVFQTECDMSETMYVSVHNWKGKRATQMAWLERTKLHCRMERNLFTKMLSYFQNIKQVTKTIQPIYHLQNHLDSMQCHLKTKHSPFCTNLPQFLLYLSISFLFSIPSFC
jgi:hypothetical protein